MVVGSVVSPEKKRPLSVSIAVIHHDGKVAFHLRKKPPYEGYLCLPGGKVEYGENPLEACKREVLEEVGLALEGGTFAGLISETMVHEAGNEHFLLFLFSFDLVDASVHGAPEFSVQWVPSADVDNPDRVVASDIRMALLQTNGKPGIFDCVLRHVGDGKYVLDKFERVS